MERFASIAKACEFRRNSLPREIGLLMFQSRTDFSCAFGSATGQRQTLSLPWTETGDSAPTGTIKLALVREPVTVPLFSGTILDEKGNPATTASLQVLQVQLPGGAGGYGSPGGTIDIEVGKGGRFGFFAYSPSRVQDMGSGLPVMPPGSTADVQVSDAGTPVIHNPVTLPERPTLAMLKLTLDKPQTVQLPIRAPLNFRIVDSQGKSITKAETGHSFQLNYTPPGIDQAVNHLSTQITWHDPESGLLRTGPVPLPGRYSPVLDNRALPAKELTTATIGQTIEWVVGSPDRPNRRTVSGRVLDAITGMPIAGAYVAIGSSQSNGWNLSRMDNALRDILWTKGYPKSFTSVDEATRFAYAPSVEKTGRTDALGRYTLKAEDTRTVSGMVFWAPHRIAVSVNLMSIPEKLLESEEIPMPDVHLITAAEIRIRVSSPGVIPAKNLQGTQKAQEVSLSTNIEFAMPANWAAKSALPTAEGAYLKHWTAHIGWNLECADTWNRLDTEWPILVPAGVSGIRATVDAPYEEVLNELKFAVPVVHAGTPVVLPAQTATVKRPYIIQVNHADGKPASGVTLNVPGVPAQATNTEGKLLAWSGGSVEHISAEDQNGYQLADLDFQVPESTTIPVVILKLPKR